MLKLDGKRVYDLPESVKDVDQSGKINDLELQIEKFKNDISRLTALKDANFDWVDLTILGMHLPHIYKKPAVIQKL